MGLEFMPRVIGPTALIAAASVQLLYLLQPVWFLNQAVLTVDDVYYFLQVARNVATLGWATFDGLHATSGVQLLWVGILTALAAIFDERMSLIRATLVLCVALNVSTGLMLRRLGTRIHSLGAGETLAVLWSFVMLWAGTTFTGMEYSLHTAIIAALLLCFWRVMTEARPTSASLALLSVLLTLNYWARLDSALFSLAIVVAVSFRMLLQHRKRDMVQLWTLPVGGAIGYAALSYAMAGTYMPISGMVKGVYAGEHFAEHPWWIALAGHLYWWLEVQVQQIVALLGAIVALEVPNVLPPLVIITTSVIGAAATLLVLKKLWTDGDERIRRAAVLIVSLWLLSALHSATVVAQIGHFSHVTRHYYGWLLVTWCLWLAVCFVFAWQHSKAIGRRSALTAVLGVIFVVQTTRVINKLQMPFDADELRNVRTELIGWIDANLPEGVTIASWNAGQMGYFLNHPVVNLDGVVNDYAFLESLRRGEPTLHYLGREGMRYIVDYNDQDLSMKYRASWDKRSYFRGEIAWQDVDKLWEHRAAEHTLYVLRTKPVIHGP